MRALVTGIGGFAGSHLAEHLLANGDEVVGLTQGPGCPTRLAHLAGRLTLVQADLTEPARVAQVLADSAPDLVYHLAAQASAAASLGDPLGTLTANVATTAAVLQACVGCATPPRVLLVTSGDMYGAPAGSVPLTEETPLAPPNAYAVSKVTAHYLGRQMLFAHGLPVIEARPFNHIGPRQNRGFVVPDFATQLLAMERGQQKPVLRVGDLRAQRDFTDVRDIVRGYRLLATSGEPGRVYHLCSGRGVRIAALVEQLVALSTVNVTIEVDPARLRPGPESVVVGSAERVRNELGWQADIPLEQSLADALAEMRARVEEPAGGR